MSASVVATSAPWLFTRRLVKGSAQNCCGADHFQREKTDKASSVSDAGRMRGPVKKKKIAGSGFLMAAPETFTHTLATIAGKNPYTGKKFLLADCLATQAISGLR
jgi:hypothetical protein